MKKLTTILLFTATLLSAQSYERSILVEIFTNSHCPLCPGAHSTLDSYLSTSANASRVNYIYYHMSFPYSDDLLNQASTADASGRNNYYGPYFSTPRGFFDGTAQSSGYSQWDENFDEMLSINSPVKLELSGSKEDDIITIKADATFGSGTSFGSSVIHFIVVEDVIYAGRNGISAHKNVMRKMAATPAGESIQTSGTQSVGKSITLEQNWNAVNTSVVVFIQNVDSKEVYQSATIDYNELTITDINDEPAVVREFKLQQNYPNPFNPATTIEYTVPNNVRVEYNSTPANVKLVVYDILGTELATLVNRQHAPGNYKVNFDASELPSGIYFYKLSSGTGSITKKMTLIM